MNKLFLKFQIGETSGGGAAVARFDKIAGDVNAGDVGAETGDGQSGIAIATAKIENSDAGLDAERFGERVARIAHESGNFGEVAFFPKGFIWIRSWCGGGVHSG